MRLLLDTHIALWSIANDPRMPPSARDMIADPANEIFVSVASLWEIAIKYPLAQLGRGKMPISAREARHYFREAGFHILGTIAYEAADLEETRAAQLRAPLPESKDADRAGVRYFVLI